MSKSKADEPPRAYLFRGDDDYAKQRELDALLASLVAPDLADFDLERLEGDSATAERVMTGVSIVPFGSPQRVVLVRYANKMDEQEQEKLASRLEQIPASGCLVLAVPAAEKASGRPRRGSEVIGGLSKAVRKVGQVREIGRMKSGEAIGFARSLIAKAGKKIDSAAASALVARVGTDSSIIASEVQKLIDYTGDSPGISEADVALVTSETPEEKIWKLVDAIGARRPPEALRLLGELFDAGDDPKGDAPRTLAMIARQFRLIWQAKMLLSSGVKNLARADVGQDLQSALPSDGNIVDLVARQPWQAGRLANHARAFSRQDLARAFECIGRTDMTIKQAIEGPEDPRLLMELLIISLARRREA